MGLILYRVCITICTKSFKYRSFRFSISSGKLQLRNLASTRLWPLLIACLTVQALSYECITKNNFLISQPKKCFGYILFIYNCVVTVHKILSSERFCTDCNKSRVNLKTKTTNSVEPDDKDQYNLHIYTCK